MTILGRPRDWRLPIVAAEAVGGSAEQAIASSAAIACLQISIILIDDILDEDPRGEYQLLGTGPAANLAAAFQAAGLAAIAEGRYLSAEASRAILGSLNQMMLRTAYGQHVDVQNPANEEAYWAMVKAKSVPFFSAALYTGALAAGAPDETAGLVKEFGALYGEMIQIHDDLNDVMATPANPDWLQLRSPLPILFAEVVDHPERQHFRELRQMPSDPAALAAAQRILIQCGAISYCVDQIMGRWHEAHRLLATASLPHPEKLTALLGPLMDPIEALFGEIGLSLPVYSEAG